MTIKLNSLSKSIFEETPASFNGSKEYAHLVNTGRRLMTEHNGRGINRLRLLSNAPTEYDCQIKDSDYADYNELHRQKLMLYCCKTAAAISGASYPETYEKFLPDQRRWLTDGTFLRTLAGIMRDIVRPVLPATMSNALEWLAQVVQVPMGVTQEIDVASNDVFIFEDDSWGASGSKPSNTLYTKPITLNPTPRTAKATVKWYQLIANGGDLGAFYNSINAGMYSKILSLWAVAMVAMSTNTTYIPSNLVFTNTSPNWVTAADRVAGLNRTNIRNIIAFGRNLALSKALPAGMTNTSSVSLDAALATMLGVDWTKYGYLGEYMGVRLMPLENAIVPGTQNVSITEVIPTDRTWLMAVNGLKPIYVGMEQGTPLTLAIEPSQSADMSWDISVTISLATATVCGSKIGTIYPM